MAQFYRYARVYTFECVSAVILTRCHCRLLTEHVQKEVHVEHVQKEVQDSACAVVVCEQ